MNLQKMYLGHRHLPPQQFCNRRHQILKGKKEAISLLYLSLAKAFAKDVILLFSIYYYGYIFFL